MLRSTADYSAVASNINTGRAFNPLTDTLTVNPAALTVIACSKDSEVFAENSGLNPEDIKGYAKNAQTVSYIVLTQNIKNKNH